MFGRRKREDAEAAEAVREAERAALFARLAERPEHICPFLGLERDRTGYVDGVSADHRCFAFGDPAVISAEQQTQVCQERGYGNCPRYLRGVLVIPTEELEALRRPRPAAAAVAAAPPAQGSKRRRAAPLLIVLVVLLLGGTGVAYLLFGGGGGVAIVPSPSSTPTAESTPSVTEISSPSLEPTPAVSPSELASPTPEPTPDAGDSFAFYEVSVGPDSYTLYAFDDGVITGTRAVGFDQFSFAQVEPAQGDDGQVYWVTQDGDLTGFAYRAPSSGGFRIRAVFLNGAGDRRSAFLDESQLGEIPQGTPAP
ncbi:MAG: hypothetical protein ABIW50_06990 [Candidatus Limnocylindria bacterium]